MCIFNILKKRRIFNKHINYLARSALGVYLIHENTILKDFLWNQLHLTTYYNSPYLPLIGIILTIIIYIYM